MNNQPELFDGEKPVAHARRTDPETSHAAAASVQPESITELQHMILTCMRHRPCGDALLIVRVRHSGLVATDSSVRTRRAELVAKGLVRDSGKREKTASGRNAIVWEVVL